MTHSKQSLGVANHRKRDLAIEEAPLLSVGYVFLLIRLTHRESETRFFYKKTWFVLEHEVKNPVSLVCVRPGLTDRVISGEELLIDKLKLMCLLGNQSLLP